MILHLDKRERAILIAALDFIESEWMEAGGEPFTVRTAISESREPVTADEIGELRTQLEE